MVMAIKTTVTKEKNNAPINSELTRISDSDAWKAASSRRTPNYANAKSNCS
jgi:hypothetical protein